jgi:glycine cleavage system H protein
MPLDIAAGDTFGSVESVKSASDILSPISGSIFEINTELEDKPSVVSQSPEDKGWLARINVSDAAEVEKSMSAADYKKFTEDADADGA